MEERQIITREGAEKLIEELERRKNVISQEISDKIREAQGQGDISENAEYDAAREEQAKNAARIQELEQLISNLEIQDSIGDGKIVTVGSKVTVYNVQKDEKTVLYIVGASETNSLEHKISYKSPLGEALMGKKANQSATVVLPNGRKVEYKIRKVETA